MSLLNKIPRIYRKTSPGKIYGLLLAAISLLAGLLLVGTSGWFITATALTGMGLLSLQSYNLFLPGAAIRFLAIAKPFTKYIERLCTHRITLHTLGASRSWIFDKIFHLGKNELVKFRSAELLNGLVADVDEMDHFYLGMVIPWFAAGSVFLLTAIFFLIVFPPFFWLAAAAFLIAGLIIPWLACKTSNTLERQAMDLGSQLPVRLITLLKGYTDLRGFDSLEQQALSLNQEVMDRENLRCKSTIRLSGWSLLQNIVLQASLIVAILIIHERVDQPKGPITVLIVLSLISLFETLQPLTALGHQFSRTVWAGSHISYWLQGTTPPPHITSPQPITPQPITPPIPFPALHVFRLSHTTVSYGDRIIHYPQELVIPARAITLVRGPNGVGKSTLLDLLSGLKTPSQGQITIGDLPLSALDPDTLVQHIGYMEQQPVLFNSTIYANIALARADATSDEVLEAARLAGLGPFLAADPGFLQTSAGEMGQHVSAGQARMIAFARIILKDAPIWLLDEPTEGLDARAEQRMIELILSNKRQKTIVIVTHKTCNFFPADHHLHIQ
jgi:ATP-binding cassette, subfamily C, bacterial CydC